MRQIRLHDLRHACATLLLTGGEELAVMIDAALGRTLPELEDLAN